MAKKYWIVDCISGYHDEDDEPFTSLKEARTECEIMNREAVKQGHEPGFWIIIDSNGKEIP